MGISGRALSAAAMVVGAQACGPTSISATQGERSVSPSIESERTVINQPLGPVAGKGDIVPIANPLGENRAARMEGRQFFLRYNCYGCHGGHAGGGMGPSLRDDIWLYGSTPDRVFNSIAQGRAHGMPAWGTRLPEVQIWELVAYVTSLRTPDEAEAPQ